MSKRMSKTVLSLALGSVLALALASVALATHPRPGGGSPLRVPFVPAYKVCSAPNSNHVAPLAFGSCTPPVLESAILTTGTAGAGQGSSRLDVFCTDNSVPPCSGAAGDQEDIKVIASASDVRCAVGGIPGCSAAGADYTGQLIGQSVIRITDHSNGTPPTVCASGSGASPCTTATVTDITFSVPAQCSDNGGANGANCSVNTTIDTLVPTTVKELQRAVVSIFGIKALDAGPDGSISPGGSFTCPPICGSGDETKYADQGLFIP
jgi:hypothetical protein